MELFEFIALPVIYVSVIALFISLAWAFEDGTKRGGSPFLAVFVVAIMWPLGILIWKWLRSERTLRDWEGRPAEPGERS